MTNRSRALLLITLLLTIFGATVLMAASEPGDSSMLDTILSKYGIYVVLLIMGWLAGRYLKPWIHSSEERLARAKEISIIADRITDEMQLAYPDKPWTEWIDKAVDKLIDACDLGSKPTIAQREIMHQIMVKSNPIKSA